MIPHKKSLEQILSEDIESVIEKVVATPEVNIEIQMPKLSKPMLELQKMIDLAPGVETSVMEMAIIMVEDSPVQVSIDSPFVYVIRDMELGMNLVFGTVSNPVL